MAESVAAILAAAGAGTRFAEAQGEPSALPKTLLSVRGRPLWGHAAAALQACELVERLVVVAPAEWTAAVQAECSRSGLSKVCAVVAGGARRQDSVHNALRVLSADPPALVAVHDGARPLATTALIRRCVRSALTRGSGVAALPVTDTLKRADPENRVESTVDRRGLWAMQTPQVFPFAQLLAGHEAALREGAEVTDDAALIERLGEPVWLVPGEATNVKVTTPADLRLVEQVLTEREGGGTVRVGHGFDAHRLVAGRRCILGGVEIPHPTGPAGYSDGDVLTHALMDAVLGALALGDIGRHFPDTDPAYAAANSLDLAVRVTELAAAHGYRVTGLDATVVAQAPRIAPHAEAMRQALALAFGCPPEAVSVKGTTTEGMGFTGTGEGIAAHAVAVLVPR